MKHAGMARRLRAASDADPTALRLSLGDLLHLHGETSGPVLLLLLALLSTIPIAGLGTVLSLGLFTLAWTWLHDHPYHLPRPLAAVQLNATWTRRCLHGLAWTYERAEHWLRPRWTALCHARTRLWWALWITLMAAVIFLPLPLGNVLPGTSLMLLSLGWLFRDGLVLLLSTAAGLAGVGYALSVGHLAWAAWHHAGAWFSL